MSSTGRTRWSLKCSDPTTEAITSLLRLPLRVTEGI
jgi:hypothetical protein